MDRPAVPRTFHAKPQQQHSTFSKKEGQQPPARSKSSTHFRPSTLALQSSRFQGPKGCLLACFVCLILLYRLVTALSTYLLSILPRYISRALTQAAAAHPSSGYPPGAPPNSKLPTSSTIALKRQNHPKPKAWTNASRLAPPTRPAPTLCHRSHHHIYNQNHTRRSRSQGLQQATHQPPWIWTCAPS